MCYVECYCIHSLLSLLTLSSLTPLATQLPRKSAAELLHEHKKNITKPVKNQFSSHCEATNSNAKLVSKATCISPSFLHKHPLNVCESGDRSAQDDLLTETEISSVSSSSMSGQSLQTVESEQQACLQSQSHSIQPSFQPRLGRGLAPGSLLELSSSPSPQDRKSVAAKVEKYCILQRQCSNLKLGGVRSGLCDCKGFFRSN